MERGQTGGLNYAIPQNFIGDEEQQATGQQNAAAQAAASAQAESLFPKDHPLAERGRMTSDYYDTYGRLKAYVTSMFKEGIDPTLPDYSQPGGGAAFQTYQVLQAGLMHTSNKLGNELKAQEQLAVPMAEGKVERKEGIDYDTTWASDPRNVYATQLSPAAQASLEAKKRPYSDETSLKQIRAADQAEIAKLDKKLAEGKIDPKAYEREKSIFERGAVFEKQQFAPQRDYEHRDYERNKRKYAGNLAFIKETTNLAHGPWDDSATSVKVINGRKYLVNTTGANESWGTFKTGEVDPLTGKAVEYDQQLQYWLTDLETGRRYVKFTNPKLDLEDITDKSGLELAIRRAAYNKESGSVDNMRDAAAFIEGYDELGRSVDEIYTPADAAQRRATMIRKHQAGATDVASSAKDDQAALDSLEDKIIGYGEKTFTLPGGKTVLIQKRDGEKKYDIVNIDEFPGIKFPAGSKRLTSKQVTDFLSEAGLYNAKTGVKPDTSQLPFINQLGGASQQEAPPYVPPGGQVAPPQNETPEQRRMRLISGG